MSDPLPPTRPGGPAAHPHGRPKRQRSTFALVVAISLGLHLVGALILGSIRIVQSIRAPEPQFEAPPPLERLEPEKLEYAVQVRQSQADSARVQQPRLAVTAVSDINLPELALDLAPAAATGVSFAGAGAGAGGGFGMGRGGSLGFGESAVSFFGVRSRGERILIVLDATRYMLEDNKGGFDAYRIVKQEVGRLLDGLAPGTLFNVAVYDGSWVNLFRPAPVAATPGNRDLARTWLAPINANPDRLGPGENNFTPRSPLPPMGDQVNHWLRAIQAGAEMRADAIFVLCSEWQFHFRNLGPDEERAWYLAQGWNDEQERLWGESVRRAEEWLRNENAARAGRGEPPRIVHWIGTIVGELEPGRRLRPAPFWQPEELHDQVRRIVRDLYADAAPPSLNFVLFLGRGERRDWDADQFRELSRRHRGRFRVLEGPDALRSVTGQ